MEPPKVVGNALIPLLNPKICFLTYLIPLGLLRNENGLMTNLGRSVAFPGHPLGSGLTPTAAQARIFCVEEFVSSGL
ncbi:hypothetical protein NC651_008186 [Populus alba x Populus x berolinensis]|nr:hypothetical protein NC651_008186 [Populus alba x Populus x berolinensis]